MGVRGRPGLEEQPCVSFLLPLPGSPFVWRRCLSAPSVFASGRPYVCPGTHPPCVSVCLYVFLLLYLQVYLFLCVSVSVSLVFFVCVYFSVDVYFCVCACSGCPCLTLWPPVCVCASTPISPFIPSLPVSLCVSSSLRGVHTCVFSVHVACVCFHVSLPLCLSPRLRLLQAGPVRQSSGCVKADSVADRKPAALPAARQCLWRWHRLGQVCGLRMRWPQ